MDDLGGNELANASNGKLSKRGWLPAQKKINWARVQADTRTAFLPRARAKQVKIKDLSEEDVVIAQVFSRLLRVPGIEYVLSVMGPTGSGKSTFISVATGYDMGITHSLDSCTDEINVVKLSFPELSNADIFFVDTPGFNYTNKSDSDVFKMIAEWLNETYQRKIHLSGLLYFHRISDNRMSGTSLKNLRMFEKLCGSQFKNIILTTTMWDEVDEDVGNAREEELKRIYWKSMMNRGSVTKRFYRTPLSAFQILAPLINEANKRYALLVQKEMTDLGLELRQTSAGATLYLELEHLTGKHQELLENIREALRAPVTDGTQLELLMGEYQRLTAKLQAALDGMEDVKTPVAWRLRKTFAVALGWKRLISQLKPHSLRGEVTDSSLIEPHKVYSAMVASSSGMSINNLTTNIREPNMIGDSMGGREVTVEALSPDDIIVLLLGPTGSGKSTFIHKATGYDPGIGHSLASCTRQVKMVRFFSQTLHDAGIVVVDTPGFNHSEDMEMPDVLIARMIHAWLNELKQRNMLVTRFLYLHNISDAFQDHHLVPLKTVCAFESYERITLVTTMWDQIEEKNGKTREINMRSPWGKLAKHGSEIKRFTGTYESATSILNDLIKQKECLRLKV